MKTNDFQIRAAFVAFLLRNGVERKRIRHELTLDTSSSGGRVDIALLYPDALIAVELKSGKDRLTRLEKQLPAYARAFDRTWLCVDQKHAGNKALRRCADVFVHRFEGTPEICDGYGHDRQATLCFWPGSESPVRGFAGNRRQTSVATNPADMSRLLWAVEANSIAVALNLPGGTRYSALQSIQERTSLAQLRPLVTDRLLSRPASQWEQSFWSRFDAENGGAS